MDALRKLGSARKSSEADRDSESKRSRGSGELYVLFRRIGVQEGTEPPKPADPLDPLLSPAQGAPRPQASRCDIIGRAALVQGKMLSVQGTAGGASAKRRCTAFPSPLCRPPAAASSAQSWRPRGS